jgi:hypothetical protein
VVDSTIVADIGEVVAVVFEHVARKHRKQLAVVDVSMKGETLLYGIVVRAGWGYASLER